MLSSLKKLGLFLGLAFAALPLSAFTPGPSSSSVVVVDMRWETRESRTFMPNLALVQRFMTEGYPGTVIAMVDDEFNTAGWAEGLDLSSFASSNSNGGQLFWKTTSELAQLEQTPFDVKLYVRLETAGEYIRDKFTPIPGLAIYQHTVFTKLSILEDADRTALETVIGKNPADADFDGFFVYNGNQVTLQSLAKRMGIEALIKEKGAAGFSDYLANHEAGRLASELIAMADWVRQWTPKGKTMQADFLEAAKNFTLLRSRLRLAPCSSVLKKPKGR